MQRISCSVVGVFVVRAARCCSLPAPIAIIDHSTGPASGCVKKPALLSAISQSYLPLTELPLSTLASPAPSSPVDTEKRAQKQLHSEKTVVAAFQEAEFWHENAEEAKNSPSSPQTLKLLFLIISTGRIIITIITPIIMFIEFVRQHFYHKQFLFTPSESTCKIPCWCICASSDNRPPWAPLKCSLFGWQRISIQVWCRSWLLYVWSECEIFTMQSWEYRAAKLGPPAPKRARIWQQQIVSQLGWWPLQREEAMLKCEGMKTDVQRTYQHASTTSERAHLNQPRSGNRILLSASLVHLCRQ